MAKKTHCPISRDEFRAGARPLAVTIAGVPLTAEVKEFSTGSLGWYLNRKTEIAVGGVKVPVQIGLNLTIVGSKELPPEAAPAHAEHAGHAAPGHEGHAAPHAGHAAHESAPAAHHAPHQPDAEPRGDEPAGEPS
jgi:hypothetical protein